MVVELELRTRAGVTVSKFRGNLGFVLLTNIQKNTDQFKKEMKNFKKGGFLTCYTSRIKNVVTIVNDIDISVEPYDYFIVNTFEL
jgi:hypothetical protein